MTILEITSSVKFEHFNLKQHHTKPAYSTGIIKHVLHPTKWKQPLHHEIHFSISFQTKLYNHCQTYSYWDYQQAWLNVFFSPKLQRKPFLVLFILIPRSILQNCQTGFVNDGITLVASLNSFTHTLWLKKATNFSNRISEA
jgi:hypothetical protein